ncbi:MAG: CCA tRNA nucleotidyltransferase [Pyrinomonadaceae bacterium]|nr:CCA tRNA nucleotidyltransferase [Pyrinomonadaceae bacterium]
MPADSSTVISRVLRLCEPTHSEEARVTTVAHKVKAYVVNCVAGISDVVDIVFGGSFAKGTWLPHHADIDIFVKIRPSVAIDKFEQMGREIGSEALKKFDPKLRYSDHPYVEAFVNNIRVNVVPCYDVQKGRWQSAADRSPFHTQYIKSHFDDEKRRQVRLLKKFFKSVGIYGAEIATEGFSGYVSEVLLLKYSSFEKVLASAANDWQNRQIIAVSDHDPDFAKSFNSPLTIIDPVDSRRNLGTAISPQSVAKFMLAARAFLEKPSVEFFTERKRKKCYYFHGPRYTMKVLLPNVLVVQFSHENKSPDIIWGKLKRSVNAIANQLELAQFEVLRSSCITDEKNSAAIAFLLESITLPPYTKKRGPEVFRRNDTTKFLSNTKSRPLAIWVDKEMRISMVVERKSTDARKFVKSLLLNYGGKKGSSRNSTSEGNSVSKGLIKNSLQIYSGSDRKQIKGLAKEVVSELASTECLIFKRGA